jgi:CheY-like chemotaxis protein
MPKKVLIFESDAAFAAELRSGLAQFGSEALVVDDANVGLQSAANSRPDLILLSIELPRTNGFSVCNRIKRDPSLKDVPLVILSSDSTDETFEQHRRLRTRAEDYIHKPIPFGTLLERIQQLMPFGDPSAEFAPPGDGGVVIDEPLVLEEGAPVPEAELNQLADRAFDALLEPSASRSNHSAPPLGAAPASERGFHSAPPPPARSLPSTPPSPRSSVPPPTALPSFPPLSSADAQELVTLRQRVGESERTLVMAQRRVAELELELGAARAADRTEELERVRRELEETRRRLEASSAGKSAASGREVLELREALNRKDKELLDLRDQLSRKDKELLCLRETNLGIERQYADLSDRILEFEKQAFELGKTVEVLKADKEQAEKRAEDQKRKAERLTEDFEAKTREILSLRDAHEAEKLALKEEHQKVLADSLAESRDTAEQAKLRALEAAAEEAKGTRERTLVAREVELRREFDGRVGALLRSHDDALGKLKAEMAQTLEEAEVARRKLDAELGSARRNIEEFVRSIAGLETDLGERTAERDTAWKVVEERERRIAALQGDIDAARSETEGVRRDLGRERERSERARAKWAEDRSSLERAKDALAVALARIEEPEGRALD